MVGGIQISAIFFLVGVNPPGGSIYQGGLKTQGVFRGAEGTAKIFEHFCGNFWEIC